MDRSAILYTLYAETTLKTDTTYRSAKNFTIKVMAASQSEAIVMAVEYIKDKTAYEVEKIWIGHYRRAGGVISCSEERHTTKEV